ncbi:MAG: hypothetical protein ABI778_06555 [Ignavibacteriota bacterium]
MTTKNIKISLVALSLTLLGGIGLTSCSTTTTNPPAGNTNVTPKAGTTYTYQKHQTDSSGTTGKTSTDSTIIATVISSGTTFQGKIDVLTLYDDFDTVRFVVEPNGDISVYRPTFGSGGFVFENPSPWLTLPFGTKKTGVMLFTKDTSITYASQNETLTLSATADYIGTDEVDTGASKTKLASGGQARITINITGTTPATVNIKSVQTYSFDLSIGSYFHSISSTDFKDITIGGIVTVLPGNSSHTEKFLSSYNLIK